MIQRRLKLFACLLTIALAVASHASSPALKDLENGRNYRSARVSSYDRTGGNADGGQQNPIKPGETRTIADIKGPGKIVHIWMTTSASIVLRM